ncbi:MAG TPA: carboxypeptidase-like regulatory domain-containing protein [Candidatus Thermoplasmatota archaeon]|nr:carboxypeptidase-like regulatory domain-containing protein [Candidatus Thermoplasmatota archaeon]
MRLVPLLLSALLLASVLGGCSGKGEGTSSSTLGAGAKELQVDDQTGGIRGVVVDQAITPVAGAKVALATGTAATTTDKEGLFAFSGLKPGDHFFTVSKPGYTTVQASATVTAGDASPPIVKVGIEYLVGRQPFFQPYKLNGFYDCMFGTFIWVDSCDFLVRTAWDQYNGSTGGPPPAVPRHLQQYENTQLIQVGDDVTTIVLEGFWKDATVTSMQIVIDSTPIDPVGDNSEKEYLYTDGASPTFGRLDNKTVPHGLLVATRGFLPFDLQPAVATNFQFTAITTLFYNWTPPKEWTFETQDQYPLGS